MKIANYLIKPFFSILVISSFSLVINAQEISAVIEDIIVTAEKRTESLQDLSQAVTVLTSDDLDKKQISTFVDISAIAPGVNVAKNEGFKTVITIRGVGYAVSYTHLTLPTTEAV